MKPNFTFLNNLRDLCILICFFSEYSEHLECSNQNRIFSLIYLLNFNLYDYLLEEISLASLLIGIQALETRLSIDFSLGVIESAAKHVNSQVLPIRNPTINLARK